MINQHDQKTKTFEINLQNQNQAPLPNILHTESLLCSHTLFSGYICLNQFHVAFPEQATMILYGSCLAMPNRAPADQRRTNMGNSFIMELHLSAQACVFSNTRLNEATEKTAATRLWRLILFLQIQTDQVYWSPRN